MPLPPRPHWAKNAPRKRLSIERVEWTEATSSTVRRFGYDPMSMTLVIIFKKKNGPDQGYVYPNFPKTVHQAMKRAPSKGTFVHEKVRNFGQDDRYPHRGPFDAGTAEAEIGKS